MGSTQNLTIRCSNCERFVAGVVRGGYSVNDDWSELRYTLVSCPDCSDPFVLQHEGNETHDYNDCRYTDWGPPRVIFPADPGALDSSVPENIARSYLEARDVFIQCSGYTASAIMCRRTLEGICKHLGADGRNLKSKLDNLHKKALIDERIHQWADYVLRGLGNEAVHDVDQVISREDAEAALDFTKAIIEYLFVFQAAFDRFKERREKKDKPPDAPAR